MDFGHMEWFEALPLPVVSYSYGGFITFREDLESEHYFCACMKPAIDNYMALYEQFGEYMPKGLKGLAPLNEWYFPGAFIEYTKNMNPYPKTLDKVIKYEDNVCHRCIKATPLRTYRNSMGMPKFKKWYGWYIMIGYLEEGILPETFMYLINKPDSELQAFLNFRYSVLLEDLDRYEEIEHLDSDLIKDWLTSLDADHQMGQQRIIDLQYPDNFRRALHKALEGRYTKINRVIENRMRKTFGHRMMSGQWSNENKLYQLIKEMYPSYKVIQHYRPKKLEGLEMDIFVKELNLGIEYQGIQHYEALEHFGGQRALEQTMERDSRKKELCEIHNIQLIYFYYDETIDYDLVKDRLEHIVEYQPIDDNTYETKDHHVMGLLKMAEDVDET